MSKVIAIVLVTAAFAVANAQSTKTSTKTTKATVSTTPASTTAAPASDVSQSTAKNPLQGAGQAAWTWMKPRFSVSAYLSTPTAIEGDYKLGTQKGSATLSTAAAMGIQAQLADFNKLDKWGVYTNLAMEQERSVTSANLKGAGAANGIAASMNTFVLGAGLIYSLNEKIYFPMGLNYPLMTETSKGKLTKFELTPQMGMQVGAAMKFNQNVSGEVMWRKVNFTGKAAAGGTAADLSDMKLEGLNIQGRYYF